MVKLLDNIFSIIHKIIEKMMASGETILDAFFHAISKVLQFLNTAATLFMDKVYKILDNNSSVLRRLSFPWGIIIPTVWLYYYNKKHDAIPTDKEGIHFFRSPVGGGKSLTSLVLAERALKLTGFASYFTSQVEKPQKALDEDGNEYWYVMHKVERLEDVYVDGKRKREWDYDRFPYVNKDERHLRFNPRMNKTREYNQAWLVEHEDELLMRHEGAKRIYKFSQHMKLDSQEMETAVYMHDIKAIKGLPWRQWMRDGLLRVYPYVIQFETYRIEYEFDGNMKRNLVAKWNLEVPIEVLDKFDTHAERRRPVKTEDTQNGTK